MDESTALKGYFFMLSTETSTPIPPSFLYPDSDDSVCVSNSDDELLLIRRLESRFSESSVHNEYPDDLQYSGVILEAEMAIDRGISPKRIVQGSSGSYFVRNTSGVSIPRIHSLNLKVFTGFLPQIAA